MIGLDTNVLARYYIDDDADADHRTDGLTAQGWLLKFAGHNRDL